MATEINVDINRKSPLIEDNEEEDIFDCKTLDSESVTEAKQETEEVIPSGYIPIKLVSNGRIKGIPKVLHFRDYSASESLDLVTPDDEDKPKAIAEVLRSMCLEDFDIKKLTTQDILVILYTLHANFISNNVTKTIYLDEDLPDDKLNDESNLEEVDIPISSLQVQYLGCDLNDKVTSEKFKVPFTISDKVTNDKVGFKLATLEDTIMAQNYCKSFFSKERQKFLYIRKEFSAINDIKDEKLSKEKMDAYITEHYDECKEYEAFMVRYTAMFGKVVQAFLIDSYNGKELNSLEEKWEVYTNKISVGVWEKYTSILEEFSFGLNENVEVYSNKLNKKLNKKIGFQLSDFISADRTKDNDRYSVLFD